MNEFDKRQFDIIAKKIDAFNEGYLHISDLIYDLESLLNILTIQDHKWKDMFRNHWWNLEQVYASALEDDKLPLDFEDQKMVVPKMQ